MSGETIVKQFFGMSQSGDVKEAVRGLSNPQFIMLLSNSGQFEAHVKALQGIYPKVPSIGCAGMSYSTRIVEKGVGIVAFYDGVNVAVNVLEQASVMPVKYIRRLEKDVEAVRASQNDTVYVGGRQGICQR